MFMVWKIQRFKVSKFIQKFKRLSVKFPMFFVEANELNLNLIWRLKKKGGEGPKLVNTLLDNLNKIRSLVLQDIKACYKKLQ